MSRLVRPTGPPWWRRAVVAVVCRRPRWATAYARRQLRLADEDLASSEPLMGHVAEVADAVERAPVRRLADRHRALRRELYDVVRHAERRLARSGAYDLAAAGLVTDPATSRAVGFVAEEVRPALDRLEDELTQAQ